MGEPPLPTPETAHFWNGTREGRLLLQQCTRCAKVYFPPRPFCPHCACRAVAVVEASGRATLYSYVIVHRPPPDRSPEPYAVAIVALEEGVRMVSNIVDVEQTPEALVLDMPLEVVFRALTPDIHLPLFRPSGRKAA